MEKVSYENLSDEQKRNLYLRNLLIGKEQGPLTGKPSVDKPHLQFYPEEALIAEIPRMSMYDYLYSLNKDHLDDIAMIFDTGFSETEITYRQFFENIDKVAKKLHESGIQEGDKVAVSLVNIPEAPYIIYALNKIGAVACLIDPRLQEYSLERDLKDLDVKMFIGISETYGKIKKIGKKINLDNIVIVPTINSSNNKLVKNLYVAKQMKQGNGVFRLNRKWSNFIADHQKMKEFNVPKFNKDKLAIISYTGGTTGVHKGVELSDDALNSLIFSHKYITGMVERGDTFMNILPQFMIYGIFTMHLALCWGLKTHVMLDPSPEHFVDNLLKINPVMVFGGPVHWETLIDNDKLKPGSLSRLKAPISGGEKLSLGQEREISKALAKAGAPNRICNGFGASELGGSVSINYGRGSKEGTVGKLHVYDNAKVIDIHTGEELTYGKEGELLVATPSMMSGYYHNRDEYDKVVSTDETGTKWFHTGDLAIIHENGDLEITGRLKRLFVCGLNNVYPPEMEEIIDKLPNVKKCAVVNVPHEELREVPKVHIVLYDDSEDNRNIIIELIKKEISDKISSEVVPHYFEFHEELKYTPNSKIDFEGIRKDDLMSGKYPVHHTGVSKVKKQ